MTCTVFLRNQNSAGRTGPGKLKHTHLQMGPDKGLLAGVVEVVPHQEVQQLGGCFFCGIEPMRKAYEKNRQIKLSIPALVAALWIIRGFATVRKADGIVSGFII